jgi:tetratricopeptide (TPR) repeat protein
LDGEFLWAHYDYGLALFQMQKYEQALEHLALVNEWEPDFDEGRLQLVLGTAYFNVRQYAAAAFHLEAARKLGRSEASLHRNLGRALMFQQRYQEAAEALKISLEIEPDDWRAEALLGDCCQKIGETDQAMFYWQRAQGRLPIGSREYHQVRQKIFAQSAANRSPARGQRTEPNPIKRGPNSP